MTISSTTPTTTSASDLANRGVAYAPEITAAAKRYNLDPKLLAAVAAQETGGPDTNAGTNIVGDQGHGHGIFQIDDRWHTFAKTSAVMNPASNANYAAGMLRGLLDRYHSNVHEALSAYNAGDPNATGTKTQWSDGQTLGYADSVLRHYQRIAGSTNATPTTNVATTTSQTVATAPSVDTSALLEEAIAERSSTLASINSLAQFNTNSNNTNFTNPRSQPTDNNPIPDFTDSDQDGDS